MDVVVQGRQKKMFSLRFFFVFCALVVGLRADYDRTKNHEIFRECAEANGFKIEEGHKKWERPTGPPSEEMLCTLKCTMEKQEVLSEGKILIEKAREDPELIKHVSADKIDDLMVCLKDIEIADCSDVKKVLECSRGTF